MRMFVKIKFISILILLAGPLSRPAVSQSPGDRELFGSNHPLKINITYDFRKLNKIGEDTTYIPGKISYHFGNSGFIERSIKILPRGRFRRDQCQHPPLWINFSDSLYGIGLFDGWGKIKLVSTCLQANQYDDYVVREYLIYKAYEKLTDISFRTYFLNITFIDSSTGKKSYESPGFFIEDIDDLEDRLDAVEVETLGEGPRDLDIMSFDIMAMFQYMIGNTDWYVQNLHNIKLIRFRDQQVPGLAPVPYDFDYAGLVNASYAVPHENLDIKSVRERYYMGVCRSEKYYNPVIKLFLDKKDEIYSIFRDCSALVKYDVKDISGFLDEFYNILEGKNPGRFIYGACD